MQAVRNVDAGLPANAGDGQHFNNGWAGNPFVADAIWPDGADHGINRCYIALTPSGFVQSIAGIKDHVVFRASNNTEVNLFDVIEGRVVQTLSVPAGGSVTITPHSRDHAGYGAYIATAIFV
jgi:hypothetical protein